MDSATLNALIREEMDGQAQIDLWDLTDAVIARLATGADRAFALRVAMRNYVGDIVRHASHVGGHPPVPRTFPTGDQRACDAQATSVAGREPNATPTHSAPARPAWEQGPTRWTPSTDAWRRKLTLNYSTSEPNKPKPLGAFTVSDVEHAANIRRRTAADTLAAAEWFERIAKAMADAGVGTVAEIPDVVLRPLLEDEKAPAA